MAILTPLPLDEARTIGRLFGLEISAIRPIRAGSVNSNFAIDTPHRPLFLRIYEEQTFETAQREAELLSHLARAGVPTPEPLQRADGQGFIAQSAGKPIAIFPFCEGDMVCQKNVTETKAREVGRAVRTIHRAGETVADLDQIGRSTRFGPDALRARLDRIGRGNGTEIDDARASLVRFFSTPLAEPRVVGLIHGDVFRDNVLWRGDAISAVLDFESASVGSFAFDLMVTVLAWCFDDDLETSLARALTAGYLEVGPPEVAFFDELFDAGRFACARFTTTRLTDFELRPRGVTVYKDFRRWWRRMQRLDALGPTGLARALGIDQARV